MMELKERKSRVLLSKSDKRKTNTPLSENLITTLESKKRSKPATNLKSKFF